MFPVAALAGLLALLFLSIGSRCDEILISPVTSFSSIFVPESPKGREECVVSPGSHNDRPFDGVSAVILFHHGADAYDTVVSWQYLTTRGASVTFACVDPLTGNMLLDAYYPKLRVACVDYTTVAIEDVDVLMIPSGYASTLEMRIQQSVTMFINAFATRAPRAVGSVKSTIVVVGGSAELLIESCVLQLLPNTTQIPDTTGPVADAMVALYGERYANAVAAPFINATLDIAVVSLSSTTGAASPAVRDDMLLTVAESSLYINEALALMANVVYTYASDQLPVNCTVNGIPLPDVWTGTPFTPTDDQNFASLASGTNIHSEVVNVSLSASCKNPSGTDFCSGRKVSVIVAHGSHDVQVISAIRAYQAVGSVVQVFCPDDLALHGLVYLMPFPAKTVSYSITCTRYYNSSLLATQSLVVVPGGPVATHRRLRRYDKLLEVMQLTGTYALFGTAMALLTTQDIKEKVSSVPHSPYTDTDLEAAGFAVTRDNATALFIRNTDLGRSKVLGGYFNDAITDHFPGFLNTSVRTVVWANGVQSAGDRLVGWIYIGFAVAAAIVVVIVMCVRRSSSSRRKSAYAPVETHASRDYNTTADVY